MSVDDKGDTNTAGGHVPANAEQSAPDAPDTPDAPDATGARAGAATPNAESGMISRRKLAYVAPLLLTRKMFYGAAGCGKGNPRIISCLILRRGSS